MINAILKRKFTSSLPFQTVKYIRIVSVHYNMKLKRSQLQERKGLIF